LVERTERETVLIDLLDGQFRIVVFNTAAGVSRDVSREFADLILFECGSNGFDIPPFLQDFIARFGQACRNSYVYP
jgi:hypothetical protein